MFLGRGYIRRCVCVICVIFCVSYIFHFPRVFVQDDVLWLAGLTVSFTSLPFVDDGCRWSVGSCAPTFSIACFYRGGYFCECGIVSSMVDVRGKRFSVVSFQRHGRDYTRRRVGVVCVMFCVSYVFFFPRLQDDHL